MAVSALVLAVGVRTEVAVAETRAVDVGVMVAWSVVVSVADGVPRGVTVADTVDVGERGMMVAVADRGGVREMTTVGVPARD